LQHAYARDFPLALVTSWDGAEISTPPLPLIAEGDTDDIRHFWDISVEAIHNWTSSPGRRFH